MTNQMTSAKQTLRYYIRLCAEKSGSDAHTSEPTGGE